MFEEEESHRSAVDVMHRIDNHAGVTHERLHMQLGELTKQLDAVTHELGAVTNVANERAGLLSNALERVQTLELQVTQQKTQMTEQRVELEGRLVEQRVELEGQMVGQRVELEGKRELTLKEQRVELEAKQAEMEAHHVYQVRTR